MCVNSNSSNADLYELKGKPQREFLKDIFIKTYGNVYHSTLNPEGQKVNFLYPIDSDK